MEARKRLRQLVDAKEILVLPGAYDALSARLAEAAGFPCVYMTGYGQSASKLGQPDVGLMTMSEMAERAADMVMAVNVPVICDADTGFGNNVNVVRTIREYERAGVAAIQLEDQTMPKKCGHMLGRDVIDAQEMVMKLKAAIAARTDPDFLIIARTDARTRYGIDEAIRRGKLYAEAGADVVFVESVEGVEEMRRVNEEIPARTIANMVETGRTPLLTAAELQELGYDMVVFPISTLYVAAKAVHDMLVDLRANGTTRNYLDKMMSFSQFNDFIGLPLVRELESNRFDGVEKKLR